MEHYRVMKKSTLSLNKSLWINLRNTTVNKQTGCWVFHTVCSVLCIFKKSKHKKLYIFYVNICMQRYLRGLWAEEPGGLQSMGSRRVGHDWVTSLSLFTFMHWRRKWQPTPVFLPGESQRRGSLVGCRLWGRRVGHNWRDLVAAAAVQYLAKE